MKWPAFALGAFLPVFALAKPEPLSINPEQSRIEIVVKATLDSFSGTLDAYKADITVESGRVVTAVLAFRFEQVHTGKDARDEMMNDWQETRKNPEGAFTLTVLEPAANGRLTARGILALHGVRREVVFPVSVITDHVLYAIDGEASLDTREFGLPVIRKFGFLKVDPLVKVRFHLQGTVKANAGQA